MRFCGHGNHAATNTAICSLGTVHSDHILHAHTYMFPSNIDSDESLALESIRMKLVNSIAYWWSNTNKKV